MKSLKEILEQGRRLMKAAGTGERAYRASMITHTYRNNLVAQICPGQNPLQLSQSDVNRKFPREIYAK